MCGFSHLTFVTTPVNLNGFLSSNSAAAEWWATSGAVPTKTIQTINARSLVVIGNPSQKARTALRRARLARTWRLERVVDASVLHRFPMGFAGHLEKY